MLFLCFLFCSLFYANSSKNKPNAERYVFINETKTWCEAQRYCREHHTDLASVRNETERWQVHDAGSGVNFWIGLFKDSWKWSDQSNSSFRCWNFTQPDNNDLTKCAAASVKDQGQWHDIKCDEQYPFICHESELYLIYSILYQCVYVLITLKYGLSL
uniref:C-type lectin domain-containing protein n=1 Tax=Astyanax mexicanus TaxID=7994 RepID=A0A8B9H3C8_ASTMX